MIYAILIFVLSFLLTMLSLPQILLVSYRKKLFDKPEARKQHRTPSSRLGGFCFVPVLFFSVSLMGAVIIQLEPDTYLSTYTDSLHHLFCGRSDSGVYDGFARRSGRFGI